jgi:hypothetical protein
MFFYITPLKVGLANILIVLLVPTTQLLLGLIIGGGYVRFIPSQIFGIGRMHICLAGTAGLFGGKMRWRVSRKNVLGNVSITLLLPQIFVASTGFLSVGYALVREFGLMTQNTHSRSVDYMVFMACIFIAFNSLRSVYWIWKTISQARVTHQEYMFEVPIPICDESHRPIGHVTRLSTTEGCSIWLSGETPKTGRIVHFLIPGHTVAARIMEMRNDGDFSFTCLDAVGLDRLKRSLYSVDWHLQIRAAPFCHRPRMENLAGPWLPANICRAEETEKPFWAAIQPSKVSDLTARIIASEPIQPGEKLTVQWLLNGHIQEGLFSATKLIPTAYKIPKDLNDREFQVFELDPISILVKMT